MGNRGCCGGWRVTVSHAMGCSCPRCLARVQRDERMAAVLSVELRAKLEAASRREQERRRMRKVPMHGASSAKVLPAPVSRYGDGSGGLCCDRCGLDWPDVAETLAPHECPPGFLVAEST